jgi:hypothetical protein
VAKTLAKVTKRERENVARAMGMVATRTPATRLMTAAAITANGNKVT